MKNKNVTTHESFGQIIFSRIDGWADFYGSELSQNHYIEMRIAPSQFIREDSGDRYFGSNRPLVKVRMSAGQFAELITSLNTGSGVPCTIETMGGKRVEKFTPPISEKEYIHNKFKDRMKDFAEKLSPDKNILIQKINGSNLSKKDKEDFTRHLNGILTEASSNIPFFLEMYQEASDKVVKEAKMEVENAIQSKLTSLGLEKLLEINDTKRLE